MGAHLGRERLHRAPATARLRRDDGLVGAPGRPRRLEVWAALVDGRGDGEGGGGEGGGGGGEGGGGSEGGGGGKQALDELLNVRPSLHGFSMEPLRAHLQALSPTPPLTATPTLTRTCKRRRSALRRRCSLLSCALRTSSARSTASSSSAPPQPPRQVSVSVTPTSLALGRWRQEHHRTRRMSREHH